MRQVMVSVKWHRTVGEDALDRVTERLAEEDTRQPVFGGFGEAEGLCGSVADYTDWFYDGECPDYEH